jgi:hypothetical protein
MDDEDRKKVWKEKLSKLFSTGKTAFSLEDVIDDDESEKYSIDELHRLNKIFEQLLRQIVNADQMDIQKVETDLSEFGMTPIYTLTERKLFYLKNTNKPLLIMKSYH